MIKCIECNEIKQLSRLHFPMINGKYGKICKSCSWKLSKIAENAYKHKQSKKTRECIKCLKTQTLAKFRNNARTCNKCYLKTKAKKIEKICGLCQSLTDIITIAGAKFVPSALCAPCYALYKKVSPRRLAKYNLTLAEFLAIESLQQNVCAICHSEQLDKRLSIDHDHVTGKVRGLLCSECNINLGFIERCMKSNLLENSINYLNSAS
jgi:hypothetical protein